MRSMSTRFTSAPWASTRIEATSAVSLSGGNSRLWFPVRATCAVRTTRAWSVKTVTCVMGASMAARARTRIEVSMKPPKVR